MADWQVRTPVVLIIFNRPKLTARVLAQIALARPSKLFVIGDGPRLERTRDAEECQATRALLNRVDWPCDVKRNYAESNLGLRKRIPSGLDWVFDTVEEAIILEDDCVPDPTFFRFCDELLDYYRHNDRVMTITGGIFQRGRQTHYSYYFSRFMQVGSGWATWRRAWRHYDANMAHWPQLDQTNWLEGVLDDPLTVEFWREKFRVGYEGRERRANAWSYQWMFAAWLRDAYAVIPAINLVSNIGFGPSATHTVNPWSWAANVPTEAMEFPMLHPPDVTPDRVADARTARRAYRMPPAGPAAKLRAWARGVYLALARQR